MKLYQLALLGLIMPLLLIVGVIIALVIIF
jgi:hypothetical protein